MTAAGGSGLRATLQAVISPEDESTQSMLPALTSTGVTHVQCHMSPLWRKSRHHSGHDALRYDIAKKIHHHLSDLMVQGTWLLLRVLGFGRTRPAL